MGLLLSAERQAELFATGSPAHFPALEEIAEIQEERDTRSSRSNPDFWEVTLSDAGWRRFTTQDYPYYESDEDLEDRHARDDQAQAMRRELEMVIAEVLTDRQREVVELYFFEAMNQRQIGKELGISQQVVSEHLYGKQRDGKAEGGALKKLRKMCAARGISWPP